MKVWIHRIAGIAQVGGGFWGATIFLNTLLNQDLSGLSFILTVIVFVFYLFTLIAGVLLLEEHAKGLAWSMCSQILQIPFLSFPLFAYKFVSGFAVNLYWVGNAGGLDYHLGSKAILDIHDNTSWGIGVNLFALVLFVLLWRMKK